MCLSSSSFFSFSSSCSSCFLESLSCAASSFSSSRLGSQELVVLWWIGCFIVISRIMFGYCYVVYGCYVLSCVVMLFGSALTSFGRNQTRLENNDDTSNNSSNDNKYNNDSNSINNSINNDNNSSNNSNNSSNNSNTNSNDMGRSN